MVPIPKQNAGIPTGSRHPHLKASPQALTVRFMISPVRRPRRSSLHSYIPVLITVLIIASITGAGYYLVRLREERIQEETARPLPPLPKPPPLLAPQPTAEPPQESADTVEAPPAEGAQ